MNEFISPQRIWVTGATGGLGQSLVTRLLADRATVMATGRNTLTGAQLQALGASFEALDLTQMSGEDWCQRLSSDDIVIHCAALSSPWGPYDDFYQVNVVATERLAQAALKVGVQRFVHISTPSII